MTFDVYFSIDLKRMKDPGLVGTYDAVVTFADPSAVDFFTKKEFSDDLVLNSRYRYNNLMLIFTVA